MAFKNIKNDFPFTTQTFFFPWTLVQSWQNDQIDIFGKTKKKNSKMIAMGFLLVYGKQL